MTSLRLDDRDHMYPQNATTGFNMDSWILNSSPVKNGGSCEH